MAPVPHDVPAIEPALGLVVTEDRGSLPYALIHGESLVACAAWALGDSGVTPVDFSTTWQGLQSAGEAVVLHDALCPMVPAWFIAHCVSRAQESGSVVVAVRDVTDTVKELASGFVGATVDRASLRAVCSPIVLPASVVSEIPSLPSHDFVALVSALAGRVPLEYVEAPPEARRVSSADDVRLLEALTS